MPRDPLSKAQVGELGPRGRVALMLEVLAAYVPLRRVMLTNDPRAMVMRARRIKPFPTVMDDAEADRAAVRLGWIVRHVVGILPTENRCLIRSLVLVRLLERRGIDNRLVIGVRDSRSAAHAWVEHNGKAVLPRGPHEPLIEL